MKIAPFSFATSSQNNSKNKNSQHMNNSSSCSFNGFRDTMPRLNLVGDGKRYAKGQICSFSTLFRDVNLFKEMPAYFEKTYPNGAKIFEYACSAGLESASVALSLLNGMNELLANKFLPIFARDNNRNILSIAKKRKLSLDNNEIYSFRHFKNLDIKKYLNFQNPKKPQSDASTLKDYKMTKQLSQHIIFGYGDVFKDLKNGKLSEEPCIVMVRNFWQFLKRNGKKELAQLLFDNLKEGSTVIIGEKDIFDYPNAATVLKNVGFKPISWKFSPDQKMYNKIHSLPTIKDFCFYKPITKKD
jgi:chemotaxis methyl-accepting protein methylase